MSCVSTRICVNEGLLLYVTCENVGDYKVNVSVNICSSPILLFLKIKYFVSVCH